MVPWGLRNATFEKKPLNWPGVVPRAPPRASSGSRGPRRWKSTVGADGARDTTPGPLRGFFSRAAFRRPPRNHPASQHPNWARGPAYLTPRYRFIHGLHRSMQAARCEQCGIGV